MADPPLPGVAAVTFDFWNTLVYEERGHLQGRRLEAWAGILEDAGFAAERQELSVAFSSAWDAYVASWTANQQFLATSAAEHCLERLGFHPPDDVKVALVDAFTNAGADATLHLTEGVAATVATLKAAGLRLGIICDVGITPSRMLRSRLEGWGLLDAFDGWAFSDEVGVYKPDPSIFAAALEAVGGVAADAAVHVGDLRRTDVAGAKAALMHAVRYRGVFDDDTLPEVEADAVIDHHRELPAVVGAA